MLKVSGLDVTWLPPSSRYIGCHVFKMVVSHRRTGCRARDCFPSLAKTFSHFFRVRDELLILLQSGQCFLSFSPLRQTPNAATTYRIFNLQLSSLEGVARTCSNGKVCGLPMRFCPFIQLIEIVPGGSCCQSGHRRHSTPCLR